MSAHGDVCFVGDVHLEPDDRDLAAFLRFLDRLAATTARLVLIGDLFDVWIGDRSVEQSHQRAVLDRLRELRRRGTVVRYLEGNRDYRIASCYVGDALDDATDAGLVERVARLSIFAVHGDLANPADRQYRAWRRFSRAWPVWLAFRLLPRKRRRGLAERLEQRLRGTNLDFKGSFPEEAVRRYARRFFDRGHDLVVLGHFHVEKELRGADPRQRIVVLPEWKGSRRHLRVSAAGEVAFVDSEYG